jgi:hypothetical protein
VNAGSAWWQLPLVSRSLAAVAGATAIVLVVKLIQNSLVQRLPDPDTRYYARKLVTIGGWFACVLLVAVVFRDRLGGLAVGIGVASAGIAFALQEVIASIAGWIAISFGTFYAPGDRVQLGGIRGDVIDIGILRTTLMELGEWVASDLYTGRVVRIANSFVFKEPVFNYSHDFPFLWDEIRIPVQHGSDHQQARALLELVLQEVCAETVMHDSRQAWQHMVQRYRLENARLDPAVTLVITDNWLEFTLRYLVDYKQRRSTRDRLSTRVIDAFATSQGAVALGSATLQLVHPDPLHVDFQAD